MGPEETAKRLMEAAKAQLVDRPAVLLTLNLAMGAYGDAIRAAVAEEREALGAEVAEILDEWERAYPTTVSPGFERVEDARPEQIAAHMARHMARRLKQQVAAAIRARGDAT